MIINSLANQNRVLSRTTILNFFSVTDYNLLKFDLKSFFFYFFCKLLSIKLSVKNSFFMSQLRSIQISVFIPAVKETFSFPLFNTFFCSNHIMKDLRFFTFYSSLEHPPPSPVIVSRLMIFSAFSQSEHTRGHLHEESVAIKGSVGVISCNPTRVFQSIRSGVSNDEKKLKNKDASLIRQMHISK